MNEYTFRFYKDEKHITTITFHHKEIEDAYKEADNFLKANPKKYDDWAYTKEPKNNNNGTQISHFGRWS